jgi:GNAT superfamily N-acetyltransferase
MTCALPHVIREAVEDDIPVVRDPWVQEMRHAPWARGISNALYFHEMKAFVGRVLRSATTLMACNPDEPGHVYGFVTFNRPNVLHWIYVKHAYQAVGLGSELFRAALLSTPIIATQANNLCFDRGERGAPPTHQGYFSRDRKLQFEYDPFYHLRNQNEAYTSARLGDPSRALQSAPVHRQPADERNRPAG